MIALLGIKKDVGESVIVESNHGRLLEEIIENGHVLVICEIVVSGSSSNLGSNI